MTAPRIAIVQPVVPDYRVPLFESLHQRYGRDFAVYAANSADDGTIRMDPRAETFVRLLQNRSWLGGQIVWQRGQPAALVHAPLVIVPGSLRILSAMWLLLRRRLTGRRTILWGHAGGSNEWVGIFRRWMVRTADGFIAYSRADGESVRLIRGDANVWVAGNSCVWKHECRPALNTSTLPMNVLAVGRLVPEKKPVLLLDAFARAIRENMIPKKAQLIFTGDGPLRQALVAQAASLGISDRVVLTGHVSDRSRLESLYAEAAVAVAPGTLGLSGIQSFAAGVPMIVSRTDRHGPELEAVKEGFNAIFFDTDSEKSLAEALGSVFRHAETWVKRRPQISEAVAECYTYEGMIAAFVNAIDSQLPGGS